ncbi:transmembrane protein 177-like isoform X2 [Homarus americanus]|uniref:transmembrane protein 177-like isoform X2 n=1 Tax=Homarus americanus TaxID=6706 RepID=UPI001C43D9CB|nr:transmembrane protein 177-like isoform X2 [Homarus americanus]
MSPDYIVKKHVTSLIDEVMDDLGTSQLERNLISLYTAYGFDIFRAGSTKVSSGGILGIPVNFEYSTIDEFVHTGITVNNEPVPWSTPEGESLKQSLVLSKDAKKFAIAREITSLSTLEPFANGAFTAAIVGMVYMMSSGVNARFNFYAKPRSLRVMLYGLVSLFGYAFWSLGKDVSTVQYEASADRAAADVGEKYATGGLEYYEKVLQRNVALRSLMGTEGDKLYTAYGNDQVLIRTKHIPFSLRRAYLKTRVEEYRKSTEGTPSVIVESETESCSSDTRQEEEDCCCKKDTQTQDTQAQSCLPATEQVNA